MLGRLVWQVLLLYTARTIYAAPTLDVRPAQAAQDLNTNEATMRPTQAAPWKAPDWMPGRDEWYRPEPGYEQMKPGDILKWRDVPRGLSVFNNNMTIQLQGAWQIQYRTTNSVGEPDATVVTLLAPNHAKKDSLFVYHWFSDAIFQDCNPSLAMQTGTRPDNAYTQKQNLIVIAALSQGWYVSIADDGGVLTRFGNGRYQGQAVLDSLRAVKRSSVVTGIDEDPKIVSFAYSGGSIAGAWVFSAFPVASAQLLTGQAAELQPTYAPDVKLAGVAIGGLIPNVTELMIQGETEIGRTAYSAPVIAGISRDHKNMTDWINENLIPEKASEFRQVYSQCFDSNWDVYTNKSFGIYFKNGYKSLFSEIPAGVMESVGSLGVSGVPKAPIYAFMTATDEATPINATDALLAKYCERGANILYERNPGNRTHAEELIRAIPGAMRWVADRFEDIPALNGCHKYDLTPESVRAAKQKFFFSGIASNALAIFGGFLVGPNIWTDWLLQFPI